MTRLLLVEDRPGSVVEFQAEGLAVVPAHDHRDGMAIVRPTGSGLLTVDLALPGPAGYRCVTALGGGSTDVPILALVGCDNAIHETALSARLRALVQRDRALRFSSFAGWPSTLGLPSREFDRLMTVVRRCGRLATQPDRQYVLTVRIVGFLLTNAVALGEHGVFSEDWHAMQFTIARGAALEHRAIA